PQVAAGRREDPRRGSRPRLQEAKTRRAGTRPSAGRGGHVMSPNPRERVVDTNSPSDSLPTPFQLPCFQVPPVPIGSWKPTSNSLLGPGDRSPRRWTGWKDLEVDRMGAAIVIALSDVGPALLIWAAREVPYHRRKA